MTPTAPRLRPELRGGRLLVVAIVGAVCLAGCDDTGNKSTEPVYAEDATPDLGGDARTDIAVDSGDTASPDAGSAADAPPAPVFPDDLALALEAMLAEAPRRVKTPGITLTVSSPTLGTWAGAAGLASTRSNTTMRPDDRLRVGSITKTFCAALVLLLVEDGTVRLDDPVDDWVDGFDFGPEITVETLLNHTSGIFNYTDDPAFVPMGATPATPEEIIAFAEEHGRVHTPTDGYNYSNTGYFLLGLIAERATGLSFAQALRERVLDPLGLDDTFSQPAEFEAAFVDGHTFGTEATDLVHMSWAWAAGGMISNGADLCTWAAALFGAQVLPAATTDEMIGPRTLSDGSLTHYGYGVRHMLRGDTWTIGHTGSTMGFRGELFFEPESQTCIAILTNDFFAEPPGFANECWATVLDR